MLEGNIQIDNASFWRDDWVEQLAASSDGHQNLATQSNMLGNWPYQSPVDLGSFDDHSRNDCMTLLARENAARIEGSSLEDTLGLEVVKSCP